MQVNLEKILGVAETKDAKELPKTESDLFRCLALLYPKPR
jgi:hypothetical protein